MPSKNQTKKQKTGFTIIEVVLVLAIAGLIFLMVFVALPALQRSQRDTQRRQDYADLAAAISSYMTNNGGDLPPDTANLAANQYINSSGNDPKGRPYTIDVVKNNAIVEIDPNTQDDTVQTKVYVVTNANCSGTATKGSGARMPAAVSSTRAFAIYGYLESGTYCQDNQ